MVDRGLLAQQSKMGLKRGDEATYLLREDDACVRAHLHVLHSQHPLHALARPSASRAQQQQQLVTWRFSACGVLIDARAQKTVDNMHRGRIGEK
jgi:hypothetical protein